MILSTGVRVHVMSVHVDPAFSFKFTKICL